MHFDIYGPFPIPRTQHKAAKLIDSESLSKMRMQIDNEGLVDGCGCYVFAIRAGKGYKPWYVGQAAKMRLLSEALNPANREKYNKTISNHVGTPVLFLIPKITSTGRFAKPTRKKDGELRAVTFLEEWLIAMALQKNPKLINERSTLFLKYMHVVGLFNPKPGEAHGASQSLKRALT